VGGSTKSLTAPLCTELVESVLFSVLADCPKALSTIPIKNEVNIRRAKQLRISIDFSYAVHDGTSTTTPGISFTQLIERMRAWRHTGFSTHNGVQLRAQDADDRRQLTRYMIRPPLALEKMQYVETSGTVSYRAKIHATLKRNIQVLPGAEWLKLLIQHIPDKHEHTVRYYGAYNSRHRAKHVSVRLRDLQRGLFRSAWRTAAPGPPGPG
jgi:hypothetical protein